LLAFPLMVAAVPAVVPARQAPSLQPVQVLETAQLMEEMFEPLYGELTRAVAAPPANRQAWRAVLSPAAKLAELHNLLFSRRDLERAGTPEWAQQVAASQRLMIELVEAVRKQDYPVARKRYEAAVDGCNGCHKKFGSDAPLLKAHEPQIGR
jgi:hypothetical protein